METVHPTSTTLPSPARSGPGRESPSTATVATPLGSFLADAAAAEASDRDGSVTWSGWPDVEAYRSRSSVRTARVKWERRVSRARWTRNLGLALCTAAVGGLALPFIDNLAALGAAVLGCVLVAGAARWISRLEMRELRTTAVETLMVCEGYAVSPLALYVAIYGGSNDARIIRTPMTMVTGVEETVRDGGSGDVEVILGGTRVRLHALPDAGLVASKIVPGCEGTTSVLRSFSRD